MDQYNNSNDPRKNQYQNPNYNNNQYIPPNNTSGSYNPNGNNYNPNYNGYPQYQQPVYDATDYEYNIKIKKMRKRNRFLAFICFIIAAVAVLSVAMALSSNRGNSSTEESTDTSSYSSQIKKGDHYAPEFNDYRTILISQSSKPNTQPLSVNELYNKCINTSVLIYSYDMNQVLTPSGSATGIIITSDGFIVTNHHVVADYTNFIVQLMDGREYEAALVGSDEKTDLAVLKIDADGLTAAEFGYVSQTIIGEDVAAIGNPSGLIASITKGIISSLNRSISTVDPYTISHLQFDAAVNSGNSGGALVNMYGQVIGIVDSKYIANYAEGMGFAISVDEAVPIIEQIIAEGRVNGRVKLGITYTTVTAERAAITGDAPGLHIQSIISGMPIASSGLKVGDIVTKINSVDVSDRAAFFALVRSMSVGDEMTLEVSRNGEILTIKTSVGAYND